jgi:hypothetical protein
MTASKPAKISSPANIYKLPKKIKRSEADLDTKVAERVQAVHPHKNWALEVKLFGKQPKPHQVSALKQVEDGKFLYKIPDMGKRNPFDFVCLGDADAIVCTIQKNKRDVCCVVNGNYYFNVRI